MKVITIQLLNQQHSIKCSDDEVENLKHSANLLNAKMLEIKQKFTNLEAYQVLMLAALNISNECFQAKQRSDESFHKMNNFVKTIESKIQTTLTANEDKKALLIEE